MAWRGRAPAARATHVPTAPGATQVLQPSTQALVQQIPSTQNPLRQDALPAQAAPTGRGVTSTLWWSTLPSATRSLPSSAPASRAPGRLIPPPPAAPPAVEGPCSRRPSSRQPAPPAPEIRLASTIAPLPTSASACPFACPRKSPGAVQAFCCWSARARVMLSRMTVLASAASPQPISFTHLRSSRSL